MNPGSLNFISNPTRTDSTRVALTKPINFLILFNSLLYFSIPVSSFALPQKAKEDARRRKSKYQFFEMIQEVTKV